MSKKNIIFEVGNFEPTDDFLEMLHSFGYETFNMDARMDKRIIAWLHQNGDSMDDCLVYKGRTNFNYKIGFSGVLLVIPVDTNKNWRFASYGNRDLVKVQYVEVHKTTLGQVSFIPTGEEDIPIRKEATI